MRNYRARRIALAVVMLLNGACSSTAPRDTVLSHQAKVATIQSYEYRKSVFNWGRYTVLAIDNTPVSKMCWDCSDRQYPLAPGAHSILIRANFNFQFSGPGPFEAYVAAPILAEEGRHYIVQGEIQDDKVKVWIMDMATGVQAGAQVVEDFGSAPTTEFTPVIIPVN